MECGGRGSKEGSSTSPLRAGATLTLPPSPFCVLHVSTGPANRVRGRETGDAALLTGRMKGGAESQGCGASRSWKRQETMLPWSLRRDQPCPHLDFSPERPKLELDLSNCKRIICVVWATKSVVICYSSHWKLRQRLHRTSEGTPGRVTHS